MKVDSNEGISKKSGKKVITHINNDSVEDSSELNSNIEGETHRMEGDEILIESKNSSKFDYNKKMDLVKKINKIKKKEYLINIFKIITKDNKDYTENTNGVFIFFHNLNDDTYEKLENYVDHIYSVHNKNNSSINIMSDSVNSINVSDLIKLSSYNDINKNLSNKEKILLRRRNYEEYINSNQQ